MEEQASPMTPIEDIAGQTMRWAFRMWGFGEAIAMSSLLEAAEETNLPELRRYVEALCLATISRGVGIRSDDHAAPGEALVRLYSISKDGRFLTAAKDLIALHERFPRTAEGALLVRADQPGWAHQLWVDSIDLIGPLYASYGDASGELEWVQRAQDLTLAHASCLQSESGLFWHGYDEYAGTNGQLWSRGQGWALLGMSKVIRLAGLHALNAAELRQRALALVSALIRTQRDTGLWSVVVDHPETYEETTLAAMFVGGLLILSKTGVQLPTGAWAALDCARAAVRRYVDAAGALRLVSSATPVGALSNYATRPFGIYPWGQGSLLLMEVSSKYECRDSSQQ
jgi:unsaturated rhamnogalacturonyl hydrolase